MKMEKTSEEVVIKLSSGPFDDATQNPADIMEKLRLVEINGEADHTNTSFKH